MNTINNDNMDKQMNVSICTIAKVAPMNEMKIDRPTKEITMEKVFVGDIHARPSLVISAIEMANGRDIIFLGDIFDGEGGAQGAKDCLDIIRAAGAELILGNHELYPLFFGNSQEELTKAWSLHYNLADKDYVRIWNEWCELRALLTEDDMAWLRSRPLWVKGKTWTAVHAKLPAGKLPPRLVKGKPTMAQIELLDNTDPDDFWARNYKGSHGLAIVGHTRRSKVPGYKCSWDHVRLIDWDAKKGGPGCVYFLEEDNMSEIVNQPEPTPPPPPENTMAFRIALEHFIRLLSQDVKVAAICGISDTGINPYHTERPMKNKKSRPPKDIVMRKSKSPRPHKDPAMSRMSRRQRRRLIHIWRKRAGIRFHGVSVPRPKAEYIYTEKYKLPGGRRSAPPAYIHVASTDSARKKKNGSSSVKTGPAFNTGARRQAALDRKRTHLTRPQDPVKVEIAKRKAEAKRNALPILRVQVKPIVAKPVVKAATKVKVVRFDDYLDATRLVKAAFGPRKANTGVKTLDKTARTARRAAAARTARVERLLDKHAIHNEWVAQNPAQVASQAPAAKAARLAVEAEIRAAQAAALAKVEAEKKAIAEKVALIRKAIAKQKAQDIADHRAAKSAKTAKAKAKAAKVKAIVKAKAGTTAISTVAPVAKPEAKVKVIVMTKPAANPDAKPAAKKAEAKPRLGTGCSFVSLPHNLRKEIAVVKFTMPAAPVREHAQVTMEALKAVAKFRKPVVATVPVAEAEPRPSLLLRLFELLPGAAPAPAPVAIPAPAPVAKPKANAEPQSLLLRLLELLPSTPSKLTIEQAADLFIDVVIGKKTELRNDIQVSRKINHGIVNCAKVAKGVNQ